MDNGPGRVIFTHGWVSRYETHRFPRVDGGQQVTGPDPDTLPGFPGWSRLVKSHCTTPREDTVELYFKEGSKHMH